MKRFNMGLAIAVGLALSTGAMALSKDEYKASKERIESAYKSEKAGCESQSKNAKDICEAKAKGQEKVALAELEESYKPGQKSHNEVRIAKADAVYAVAVEKCDDQSGNAKDVCVKEAKANHVAAKADAKATGKVIDAHKDASVDKREAELKLANAKCDALSGAAKDSCLTEAKAHYGKL